MDDIITVSVGDSKYTITEMSEVKALFMIPLAPRLNDAWERRMGTTQGRSLLFTAIFNAGTGCLRFTTGGAWQAISG
jgi:hypothetical protein